jgi:hypothetical protein
LLFEASARDGSRRERDAIIPITVPACCRIVCVFRLELSLRGTATLVVVVVEVGPEPPAELAQAAIDGCNGALGAGSCRLNRPGDAAGSEFYALVREDRDRPGVFTIELRERRRDGRVLETRELTFAERDTPVERSTSLGVVIAALVAAQDRRGRAASKPVPPPPAPHPAPAAPHVRTLRIDLGLTVAHALKENPIQLGGLGRLSLVLPPFPLFLTVAAGYESRLARQPSVAWLVGAAGVGVRVGSLRAPLGLELRSEMVAERVAIGADDPAGDGHEEADRWRFGARWGAEGVWSWTESLALLAGAQLTVLRPSIVVELQDEVVETAPAFSWGFILGVRYSL